MEKTFVLYFNTADKKTYRVNINHPKEGLTKSVVEPIAQKIIDTKIFNNEKRVLASLKKAAYITREESALQ